MLDGTELYNALDWIGNHVANRRDYFSALFMIFNSTEDVLEELANECYFEWDVSFIQTFAHYQPYTIKEFVNEFYPELSNYPKTEKDIDKWQRNNNIEQWDYSINADELDHLVENEISCAYVKLEDGREKFFEIPN